jgi:hypothetical protein
VTGVRVRRNETAYNRGYSELTSVRARGLQPPRACVRAPATAGCLL